MPSGVYSISGVTTEKLPAVVGAFRAEGATVTTTQDPDGTWTVVAVYPKVSTAKALAAQGAKKAAARLSPKKRVKKKASKKK